MADLKRVLDYDPTTRTKTTFHYDWKTDDIYLQKQQDCEPVIEDNKTWINHVDQRNDFRRVASIPLSVYYQIPLDVRRDGKALKRWLNEPDNRAFRTWHGTV